MKYIESTQNKQIKEHAKLLQKKKEIRSGLFLVEGHHMIEEAMSANCLKEIYLLEGEDNFTDLEPIFVPSRSSTSFHRRIPMPK